MPRGYNFYEPIERAVSGINQQININSQRADSREARGLQKLLTYSQLQTSQENRELNRNASERADKQLAETVSNNAFMRTIQTNADNRAKNTAAQQLAEFNATSGQRQAAVEKTKEQFTPADVNVYNFVDNNIRMQKVLSRPPMITMIESVYGGSENVKFDPSTGNVVNRHTNQPIKISPYNHANKFYSALDGVIKTALDPQAIIRGDITQLEGEINQEETKLKENKINSKGVDLFVKENAQTKAKINKLKSRLYRRQNVTIDDKLDMYKEQENRMLGRYIKAQRDGIRPEIDVYFQLGLARNATMQDRLHKEKLAGIKAIGSYKAPKGVGTQEWVKVMTALEHEFYKFGPDDQFIKTPGTRDMFNAAAKLTEKYLVEDGMAGISARNKAVQEVKEDEEAFWEDFAGAAKELGITKEKPSEKDIKRVYVKLKQEGFLDDVVKGMGYIPRPSRHPSYRME